MTPVTVSTPMLRHLDDGTAALVRLSASVAAGSEADVRRALTAAGALVAAVWVEELILQSYLFAGFPRSLNAMREWRRLSSVPLDEDDRAAGTWPHDGERTCATVYGGMYDRLRDNIRALHPRLDEWMIVEGYGKVLSRPGLDLPRRELCIIAACAASGQDRQLHSHLHGALNVGVAPDVITAAIDALAEVVGADRVRDVQLLWVRVQGK